MVKYEDIKPNHVLCEIIEGEVVYALDKKLKKVVIANDSIVKDVIAAIESKEENRYLFWIITEDESEADNGETL